MVDKLIEHGADVSWSTGAGLTPWMLALDAQRMPDHPTRTDALVSAYDTLMAALVAAGARHGASSDVHLVGSLPMKAIAKAGVTDTSALDGLFGAYHFVRVVPGADPQQLAAHESIRALTKGAGSGSNGEVTVASHAVGGGPMPVYAVQREGASSEMLVMQFDAQPGAMTWQIVGGAAGSQGASGESKNGAFYLRGHLPEASRSSNYLDPASVKRWEVAVVPGGRGGGAQTKWIRAPKLRVVRRVVEDGVRAVQPEQKKDEL